MKYLIKKAKVICPNSSYHHKVVDIFINKGVIENIKSNLGDITGVKVISSKNLHVSIGWMDIGTQIGEPGLEYREDLKSITKAAKAGGYTSIAPFPNTNPVVQNKASIKFLLENKVTNGLEIVPLGALSIDCAGQDITEMIDLHATGAKGFTDGLKSIAHTGLMARALEYVKSFDGVIIHHSSDKYLAHEGQMHEGETSTMLGMKGLPSISESISIKRDIELLQYTKSKLCLYALSTAEGVKVVKESKKGNSNIFSTVAYLNLIKTDQDLAGFDSNLKVLPPLRSKKDRQDLIKGLNDNTIDAIVSNHYPLDEESKKLEFTYAKFGASGIETCFAAINTFVGNELSIDKIIEKLTEGPRRILGMELPQLKVGAFANLTLFDPQEEWIYDKPYSKSIYNPFFGQHLKGKVIAVVD